MTDLSTPARPTPRPASGSAPARKALFDAYVIVDWSAAAEPRQGRDSIWFALYERRKGLAKRTQLANPATREEATERLKAIIDDLAETGRRALVGFDFPLGYPHGLAHALGLDDELPWHALWDRLSALIRDDRANANNRFEVAAYFNRMLSGTSLPFWGCPAGAVGPTLTERSPWRDGMVPMGPNLPERRRVERLIPRAQSVWKLYTTGSVGGQALTGIPRVKALRDQPALADVARVWPFETGFDLPHQARVVFAEVYPSMVTPADLGPKFPEDAGQVVALAEHFARLDDAGELAPLFRAGATLPAADRLACELEEGWVLGVMPPRPAAGEARDDLATGNARSLVAEPTLLAERSLDLAAEAVDLSRLPEALQPLALALVATTGDPTVVERLSASETAVEAAQAALAAGAPILVDHPALAAMLTSSVFGPTLPGGNPVVGQVNRKIVTQSQRQGLVPGAAAVDLWDDTVLEGAVVAIGSSPAALLRLIDRVRRDGVRPAVILGFPVGFAGATEAKAELMMQQAVPWIALAGRRGGSMLAAAVVAALAGGVLPQGLG